MNLSICRVRPWRVGDEASLALHANNRKIWQNLLDGFPHPYTLDDACKWIARMGTQTPETHWAIQVAEKAVGGIGIELADEVSSQTARIGFWLGEDFWGKGIMTEAVSQVVSLVWSQFDHLLRLEACVFPRNLASIRVLEKSGFRLEQNNDLKLWKDGQLVDCFTYALSREQSPSLQIT